MPQFCRTYSPKHCNVAHQCYKGQRFEIKCDGCGDWHWVDFEGYRIKYVQGGWLRTKFGEEDEEKGQMPATANSKKVIITMPTHVMCKCVNALLKHREAMEASLHVNNIHETTNQAD